MQSTNLPYKAQSSKDPVFVFCSLRGLAAGGGVLASRKRLTSMLKLALDLKDGISTGREFHNWSVDGRNDLARLTRFDLGTSTARSFDLTDRRHNLGSCTWMFGISWHNNSGASL